MHAESIFIIMIIGLTMTCMVVCDVFRLYPCQEGGVQMQKKQTVTKKNGEGKDSTTKESRKVLNSTVEDSSAKIIFEDPILCSQFLRGYTMIPLLKDVQPEDIEDVTERYVHMFTEERNSDVVKKVHVKNYDTPFYLISLIEHKSQIGYNSVMQILRYMVYIWEDYEKNQEMQHSGISKTKGFKYPPVLPIIYYSGRAEWTAAVRLADRIYLSEILSEYIPDFRCILVQVKDYDNKQLQQKNDEFSLIMMLNKMHEIADFARWKEEVNLQYLEEIIKETPQYLLGPISQVTKCLLLNINVPIEEAESVADRIKERDMAGLFDHFEKYDVQATRAEARAEGVEVGKKEAREENIAKTIRLLKKHAHTKEEMIVDLIEEYNFSEFEANEKLNLYWK